MTLRARRFREGSDEVEEVELEPSSLTQVPDRELVWVDTDGQDGDLRAIEDALASTELMRAVVMSEGTAIRFAEAGLSLTMQGLCEPAVSDDPDRPRTIPVHLVLRANVVVGVHAEPVLGLSDPIRIVASDPRFGRLDAGTFLGLLMDGVLNGFFELTERLERDVDELDELALGAHRAEDLLGRLVAMRRRIATLRRSLAPQREVFAALLRPVDDDGEPSPIGRPWPGLSDRLERAIEGVEHARELLLGTFDIVMTRTGQRTNDVMRVLTVISSLLLPSVVIAGVMGMNFHVGFFEDSGNFLIVLGVMLALAVGTLLVARLRGWL